MNQFPRISSRFAAKDAGSWICNSCAKSTRSKPQTPFFNRSIKRAISNSSKPQQNAAPTMEQLRAPFAKKNNSTLYYTLSIILGTVAFSYGSVPLYKMVRHPSSPLNSMLIPNLALRNRRMGWPAHKSSLPRRWNPRRPLYTSPARYLCQTNSHHLQRIRLRCSTLEVHSTAARSTSPSGRDSPGILHRYE